jgi:hypothetical protein
VRRALLGTCGQASVELVGLLPLLVGVAFGAMQLLAAGAAHEVADAAAEAGAVALLQRRDPREAARASLPGWSRARASVAVSGRRVRVRVVPRGPIAALTRPLAADATADAGPEAAR